MFWKAASYGRPSAIEGILNQEAFSLEDLLQEDDLVQEVKAANQRLLDFLLQEAQLARLLGLMLAPPEPGADEERALKLRLGACEVLCSGSEEVADAVLAHPAVLPRLFAAPAEGEAPPDATAASCFVRVAGQLLAQRGDGLLAWLQEHAGVLEGMADRLATAGVPETLQRMVGADDSGPPPAPPAAMAWMRGTRLLPMLVARLEGGGGAAAEGAAEVLTAVARAQRSPLTAQLAEGANLAWLVARISGDAGDAATVQALNICIALVERRRQWEAAAEAGAASPPTEADRQLEAAAVEALAEPAAALLGRLAQAQGDRRQETPFGLLAPPLGSARLTAVVLLAVLTRTGLPAAEGPLTRAGLVRGCLDLLLAYPFNSILHHQVTSMVAGILECGSDALLEHLLDGCQLLSWLAGAPLEVEPVPLRGPPKPPLRAGYSGHLTLIGNKLLEAAEARPLVARRLQRHEAWQAFAAGHLAEANRVEDVGAWECGRPSPAQLGGGDSDDDFGTYGGANGGGFAGLVEAASDSDSDSEEELSPGGQRAFEASATALAGSPAGGDLGGLRARLWDDDGSGSDGASPTGGSPGLGGGDLSLAHSPQRPGALGGGGGSWGAPQQPASASYLAEVSGSPDVPNSWEDLALDAAADELPPRRLTPRPPPPPEPAAPPPVVGFAPPAEQPAPPGGRRAGSLPPPSALSERLRGGGGGGEREVEAAEATAVERLLQASARETPPPPPATGPAEAEPRPGKPWLSRGGSADLDAHPLSGRSSLDLEDAGAELSAASVAAELEQLDLGPGAGPWQNGAGAAAAVASAAGEHEEQTLVGSFTKLEPGTSQPPPAAAAAAPPSH